MSKTFNQMTTAEDNSLLVVDALNLAFRWKHSGAKQFIDDYINTVKSLARSYKSSKVIIAADQGSSSFRKAIYPEYKANRKEKFETQTEAEKRAFEDFFEEFTRTLNVIQEEYPVLQFQGVEADDIAGCIVNLRKQYGFEQVWLVSSDRDWDLLLQDNVSRFSYVTRKEYTLDNWGTHYDFPHEDYISIKCLTGDTGDNVFGVPGIGPKRAVSLVQQYGTALDLAMALPITSKYKYITALNEFGKDNILLNYRLMDLVSFCEEAVGPNNLQTIKEVLDNL